MSNICPKCGLPKELCVCETIAKESQKVIIRTEKRAFGKKYTIVEGIDDSEIGLSELAKKLKSKLACGGTVKDNQIELQGDHKRKVREILTQLGFVPETIEVQ
ncbi:stress response translation initiation inhibitor YciH [Candidatus Woesearchaeota archaeon]|nr:stress response translation initiation inhibitor YciH [Candidatus Woesearchaeota archaeon]MBW3017417.1 stress response translation initiation inhibitor YciH [Candidatus Woesearchaeota archaeon]